MAIVESIGGYLAEKAVRQLCSLFKTNVIERWTRYRAEEFVKTFCDAVTKGCSEDEIKQKLDEIVNDDVKSAALFDAYRRVSLSASSTIGPRIIALVTARIVGESRNATSEEDRLMAVAELLTDNEMAEVKVWYDKYIVKLQQKRDGNFYDPGPLDDVGSTDLRSFWGSWAAKLEQLGFITQQIRIVQNKRELGDGVIALEKAQLATDMYYDSAYTELVSLINLAS